MVGAGVGDDAVPDDGGVVGIAGASPFGCYVYKKLLRVPCEEGREVCLQREADDGILFLFRRVVVGSALDTVDFGKMNELNGPMYNRYSSASITHTLECCPS